MSDSKTYSSETTLIVEMTRLSERVIIMLEKMGQLEKHREEDSKRITRIEQKLYYATGVVTVISASFGFAVAFLIKKWGG